jgi:dTMP kinase
MTTWPFPIPKSAYLIALIGTDGSGKSTQARLLAEWLESRGREVTLQVNRANEPLRSVLAEIAAAAGARDVRELLGDELAQFLAAAFRWRALLDVVPHLDRPGAIVVVDRYSYCYVAAFEAVGLERGWIVRKMFDVFPTPDLTIYLDVSPEVAARREDVHGAHAQGIDFIRAHGAAYRRLPEASSFALVDADRSFDEVREAIRALVERKLSELTADPPPGAGGVGAGDAASVRPRRS